VIPILVLILVLVLISIIYMIRWLKLNLKVEEGGAVRTDLPLWEDILQESSFRIEPSSALIDPYSSQTFRVTLLKTGKCLDVCVRVCVCVRVRVCVLMRDVLGRVRDD
jgi:hypothetical protein